MSDGKLHSKQPKFAKVPGAVFHDLRLTDGDVRLYAHMHWRYGSNHTNYESKRSMAKYLGVSEKAIQMRIKNLEAAGWIVVIERSKDAAGRQQTPFYHLFETRSTAAKFRSTYVCKEGETVRPKRTMVGRKLRNGAGNTKEKRAKNDQPQELSLPRKTGGTQVPKGGNSGSPELDTVSRPIESEDSRQYVENHAMWKAFISAFFAPPYLYAGDIDKCRDAINVMVEQGIEPEWITPWVENRINAGVYYYRFYWLVRDMHLFRKQATPAKEVDEVTAARRAAALEEIEQRKNMAEGAQHA